MLVATRPSPELSDRDGEVRRHPRILLSIPITLRHLLGGEIRMTRGVSLDISEGGMGALVEGALHVGDMVTINMNLTERDLNTIAIVRHSSSVRSGFEFLKATEEERFEIRAAIRQARAG